MFGLSILMSADPAVEHGSLDVVTQGSEPPRLNHPTRTIPRKRLPLSTMSVDHEVLPASSRHHCLKSVWSHTIV